MLKRIVATTLMLVASFSVSAQWKFEEKIDKMTDAPIRFAVAHSDSEVEIFVSKRQDGSLRLMVGRGVRGTWTPAIEGTIEVRIDSNKLVSRGFGPKADELMPPILRTGRTTNSVSMLIGNVGTNVGSDVLSQIANGTVLRVRVDTFLGDRLFREISLEGAREALMQLTDKPTEWFNREATKP